MRMAPTGKVKRERVRVKQWYQRRVRGRTTSKGRMSKDKDRVGLWNEEAQDITPKFEAVLKEIFTEFDQDKDGALNDDEINNYFKACNDGKPIDEDSLQQIRENFIDSEKKEKNLTFGGFVSMYCMQTGGDESETWKDLEKLGYDENLKKKSSQSGSEKK
eukprot:TRINITY_DN6160_c0_g1_i1.p1 TRINITY_DN6160_c0_g1~~TRINITY_DN6160_c0_g1_i1.p1  ORF type:complete len:160 (-),score=52.85 TRINITY_DN6160_c0_g1_i1:40-519(-)